MEKMMLTKNHTQDEIKKFEVSHVEKLKKVISLKQKTFIEKSDCLENASYAFFQLTGKSSLSPLEKVPTITADKFFSKKAPATQNLFVESGALEHSIFHIKFDRYTHALLIEKKSNKERTEYRIYQSWIDKFTLKDWLEGDGKHPYTQAELINFFKNMINQIANEKGKSSWYNFFCCCKKMPLKSISIEIIKFQFKADILEKNYNRICRRRYFKLHSRDPSLLVTDAKSIKCM